MMELSYGFINFLSRSCNVLYHLRTYVSTLAEPELVLSGLIAFPYQRILKFWNISVRKLQISNEGSNI